VEKGGKAIKKRYQFKLLITENLKHPSQPDMSWGFFYYKQLIARNNKHMMTINFDTITNNYEVIYVIKTVMKYYLKKNRYEFSSVSSKYGLTFISHGLASGLCVYRVFLLLFSFTFMFVLLVFYIFFIPVLECIL
jgi:hypothetical protein